MSGPDIDLSKLKERAYKGSAEAQCKLGLRFELGDDIPHSDDQALYWYGLAAAQGDLFAKTRIAEIRRKKARQAPGGLYGMGDILRDFYTPQAQQTHAGSPQTTGSVQNTRQDTEVVPPVEEPAFDLEAELSALVGMEEVKQYFRRFSKQAAAAKKRQAAGHTVDSAFHPNLVISGAPGTGKTTVARLAARLFRHLGYLKTGKTVETVKSGMVSEYTSQTAKKTSDLLLSALGGMLVIDEAHTFLPVGSNNANAHDREALETLDAMMEKHTGELSVVLTGSRKEIEQLLRQHPGLKSRFSTVLSLPDYTSGQLFEILEKMIAARGFLCSEEGKKAAFAAIRAQNRAGDAVHTNAHLCRGILENAILRQSVRIVDQDVAGPGLITLEAEDFEEEHRETTGFDLEARFSSIIGLESIKDFLRGLHAQLRLEAARKAAGLDTGRGQSLHMVFRGNPGTGKTMMARILAELFQSMGVLRTGNLVETDRGGLVAGYVGQTAEKTREKVREALDGVLFVDEAYALVSDVGSSQGFGQEAVDTLVKDMDDNRDRLIVVLAGYCDEMDAFIASNPGLRSRFPTVLTFEDYTLDELMAIAELFFAQKKYVLSEDAKTALREHLGQAMRQLHFGNGRYARNLYEKALRNQAMRLLPDNDLTREELQTITAADIPQAAEPL